MIPVVLVTVLSLVCLGMLIHRHRLQDRKKELLQMKRDVARYVDEHKYSA